MKRWLSALLAMLLMLSCVTPAAQAAAAPDSPVSGSAATAEDGKTSYTWSFADASGQNTYDYIDDYAAIQVGLGSGDSFSNNGIVWSGPSCKEENDTNGLANAQQSNRYILITPTYTGTVEFSIAFSNASTNQKGRIWYNTSESGSSIDLAQLKKGKGTQIGSDFTSSALQKLSFPVVAGTYMYWSFSL